ncbi:MAG: VOC family protein [Peptoniphilaceae bacterium]|uniref:VOC family protein n=1 Tax=Parvimonas sp. TaxID=1944660 RepID=UPI0025E90A67|nr:VOC family protein [Parvimonas sp.]MCI5997414.1 VOC family protein [Parvimonas sp.]MDD7765499.1 VOC family protein [Peptoniphilaceae bacterium]MDY3051040.1 VOC family protein [Parvimonas sp.]
MINSNVKIMLYMNNPERSRDFWCDKLGFVLVETVNVIGVDSYVVSPSIYSDVRFVIHNKKLVEKLSPDVNTEIPSILLTTSDIEKTMETLKEKGVVVGEIQINENIKSLNFADFEGNYYAILEER